MLAISFRLIDAIEDHCYQSDHNRNLARTLTKATRKSLEVDRRLRAEIETEEMGSCLETIYRIPSDLQGEYLVLKLWCLHAS